MGLDHFNDLKSTTSLPEGFSMSDVSRISLLDIVYKTKSTIINCLEEWIVYIIHATALEKFMIASIVMSSYLFIYVIVFIVIRSDIHPHSTAKGLRSYFDMIEEEEDKNDPSGGREYSYRPKQFTIEELKQYNGKNGMPILVALKGKVYDVTSAFAYYGPSGSYACLAGREASRAVAKLNFDEKELCNDKLDDLKPRERQSLEKWVEKFKSRNYQIVGIMLSNKIETVKLATSNNNYAYESKDKTL